MAGPYICLYFSYLFLFRKVKIKRVVAQLNSNINSVIQNEQNGIIRFGSDVGFIQTKPSNGNIYRLQIESNGAVTLWYSVDGGREFTPKQISSSPFG